MRQQQNCFAPPWLRLWPAEEDPLEGPRVSKVVKAVAPESGGECELCLMWEL